MQKKSYDVIISQNWAINLCFWHENMVEIEDYRFMCIN